MNKNAAYQAAFLFSLARQISKRDLYSFSNRTKQCNVQNNRITTYSSAVPA